MISEDGRYRYHLCRWWGQGPRMVFVMLNPSTADASVNDPTIVRCMGFAEREGLDGIDVVNLYAFRTPKPTVLWTVRSLAIDIVGSSNDAFLRAIAREAATNRAPLVAAWGANAEDARVNQVLALPGFDRLLRLGDPTKGLQPRHPLYLKSDTPLVPHRGAA